MQNPTFRYGILAALLSFLLTTAANAAPPTDETVDALLVAARLERTEGLMRQSLEQLKQEAARLELKDKELSSDQQRSLNAQMEACLNAVREEASWENLRPIYRQIYKEAFSQDEIDGLIAFYKSPVGVALLEKQPIVLQKATAIVRERMAGWKEKFHAAAKQALDNDRAIQDYDQAIRLKPDDADAFKNRGIAYSRKGDNDRAIQDYDEAIRLKPDNAATFYDRGNAYSAKGDNDRAIRDYNQAIRLKPDYAKAFNNRCVTRATANMALEEAVSDCNESLRLKPDDANTLGARGFVYFRLGRYDEAIADFDKGLSRDPKSAGSLYARGLAKRMRHDVAGGDADIAAAKTIEPKVAERFAGYGIKP